MPRMVRRVMPTLIGLLRLTQSSRAMIKTVSPEDTSAKENLYRELASYLLPGVGSAACFRKIYDTFDHPTVAAEWLDTTLAKVDYQPDMHTYALIKSCLKAALASSDILDCQRHVNTGAVSSLRESSSAYQSRLQTC